MPAQNRRVRGVIALRVVWVFIFFARSWDGLVCFFVKVVGILSKRQRRGAVVRARGGALVPEAGHFLVNKFLNIFLRTRRTQFNGYCQSRRCGGRTLDEFPLEIQAAA